MYLSEVDMGMVITFEKVAVPDEDDQFFIQRTKDGSSRFLKADDGSGPRRFTEAEADEFINFRVAAINTKGRHTASVV